VCVCRFTFTDCTDVTIYESPLPIGRARRVKLLVVLDHMQRGYNDTV